MMKRIAALFAALALALALTACGETGRTDAGADDRNTPNTNQSQNAPLDDGNGGSWQNGTDTPTQPGAGVGGAEGSQSNSQGSGSDVLPGDTQDNARMGRNALRRGAQSTATFRQMLENGHVHDSDGFLNDGENTSW